jgi:hypothetical protein
MASPPLIFEAMPPLAAWRRPAQFALPSVLKCREAPGRMSPLGHETDIRTYVRAERTSRSSAVTSESDPDCVKTPSMI